MEAERSTTNPQPKPLQVNPIKHSQPMGATLAFLGVRGALPLMHGAQGCASYTKVFFTRHFNEPIAISNTSVSDITAVLDGGHYTITQAVDNLSKKMSPSMIGLHTTGLTETKGDDVKALGQFFEIPYVYVNTPDYEGGMESGWALTAKALVTQLVEPATATKPNKMVVLPHVSMTPGEVEKLKELCEEFGFEVYALPDLSTSLDGYLDAGQGKLSNGGITVDEIIGLGDSSYVISIGRSMAASGDALAKKNPRMKHLHFDHLMGLDAADAFVGELMALRHIEPTPRVKRWRARLQDAMLDSHFLMGSSHFVVTGEPDHLVGMCELIRSVGGTVEAAVSTVNSPVLSMCEAKNVIVGDLEDAQEFFGVADCVVSNFHAARLLGEHPHTCHIVRGFPNYEELGNQLKSDLLYEGAALFLFEAANLINKTKHHH